MAVRIVFISRYDKDGVLEYHMKQKYKVPFKRLDHGLASDIAWKLEKKKRGYITVGGGGDYYLFDLTKKAK